MSPQDRDHMIQGCEEEIRYEEIMREGNWPLKIRRLLEKIAWLSRQ